MKWPRFRRCPGFLDRQRLRDVQQAVLKHISPHEHRKALFQGIDSLTERLTVFREPMHQIRGDLHFLNWCRAIEGHPEPPFVTWLDNAIDLSRCDKDVIDVLVAAKAIVLEAASDHGPDDRPEPRNGSWRWMLAVAMVPGVALGAFLWRQAPGPAEHISHDAPRLTAPPVAPDGSKRPPAAIAVTYPECIGLSLADETLPEAPPRDDISRWKNRCLSLILRDRCAREDFDCQRL